MEITVTSHERGHEIYYDFVTEYWRYSDTGERINHNRKCVRCGCLPTKDGHDNCLGIIVGVSSACCGHGVAKKILMREESK